VQDSEVKHLTMNNNPKKHWLTDESEINLVSSFRAFITARENLFTGICKAGNKES
jgi:hypothetical protein